MSVNAAFSFAFKPNPLYRNLREDVPKARSHASDDGLSDIDEIDNASVASLSLAPVVQDVDDELLDQMRELEEQTGKLKKQVSELSAANEKLTAQVSELTSSKEEWATANETLTSQVAELTTTNEQLHTELTEMDELMETMQWHIESLEAHQQSLIAYANKVCNDVKTVKRRSVREKIEHDKERQLLVEELYSWKMRAEELKATENDAVAAAEAKADWEAACLNQNIEQLQGEILMLKTELDETKEELSRRGATAEETAETEQMVEALKDLVLDLQTQVEAGTSLLQEQKAESDRQLVELYDTLTEAKQRHLKESIAFEKERQELADELQMWKNRALEGDHHSDGETTATFVSGKHDDTMEHDPSEQDAASTEAAEDSSQDNENSTTSSHHSEVDHEVPISPVQMPTESADAQESKPEDNQDEQTNSAEGVKNSEEESDNQREEFPDATRTSRRESNNSLAELEAEDDDVTLLTPQHSDSFFNRFRSFSFRSRTDSMSSINSKPDSTTAPPRYRANSMHSTRSASSTNSTSSSRPQFYQQESRRLNSLRNLM
ncbi:hypothetical protein Poli38472_006174 [Pythium oligandrum]|uniref:Uncharacterized protein n=1 Tax=Pythium oligandrum TaxID=41045 RepID=A0A8K1CRW9_PYTOL|nr:hypothetical protein Poli38472_006174 [Pythium oligandrum]|eukprot:TMW68706.1 hypothetical protein Poli38472_006174 [Pythium oligandrum]